MCVKLAAISELVNLGNNDMSSQYPQGTAEVQSSSQVSQELKGNQQKPPTKDAAGADSGSASIANSDNRKVSREDIELVQNLIERCLQLYMTKGEVVRTLSSRARIEPGFTILVWQKLEEENSEFFRAYYIRLQLRKQILLFNHLLERQYHLMNYSVQPKVPLAPIQNGIHPMPVNNLPMAYPVLQQPPMPTSSQPHVDPMACGASSCHVVNGIPASGSFHPIRMNSCNDIVMDGCVPGEAAPVAPCSAMSSISEMAVSPASVASSNHFPFTPPDLSGIGMDISALDTNFTSDVANTGGLQLGPDGGVGSSRDSLRSLGQWNFSLTDITTDFTNMEDLGALGNYTGSPFLPPDSDILLDSPEHEDMVEGYFADAITGACPQSDEENHTQQD